MPAQHCRADCVLTAALAYCLLHCRTDCCAAAPIAAPTSSTDWLACKARAPTLQDNTKIVDFIFKWLTPASPIVLDQIDADDPDLNDYHYVRTCV